MTTAEWVLSYLTAAGVIVSVVAAVIAFKARRDSQEAVREARRVADAEVDRDHNAYEPARNGVFVDDGGLLHYEFVLPRDYEMRARTTARGGAVVNDPPIVLRTADQTWRIMIDGWTGHATAAAWETLTIKFWPPAPTADGPEPWTCRCERETVAGDGRGHWQWTVGVPQSGEGVLTRSP